MSQLVCFEGNAPGRRTDGIGRQTRSVQYVGACKALCAVAEEMRESVVEM